MSRANPASGLSSAGGEAVIQKSDDPQVVKLANAIRTAQLAEIDQMRQMLKERDGVERSS